MKQLKEHPMRGCIIIFFACFAVRIIEYFVIRTDETFLSENFLHKVFGIILLKIALKSMRLKWKDIGFCKTGMLVGIGKGLLLGGACFAIAYFAECMILYCLNGDAHLAFYASGFSLTNNMEQQSGAVFIALCGCLNLINVWMEEGIFRGLFTRILESDSFMRSISFIAFLFGIWHWVMPFRDFLEGKLSVPNLLIMGIGYIILAGLMSVKWSLLYEMTGSLWMGLGDHLFNNVIVTNFVHVISNSEADSMQIVRILIGQILSFGIVLIYRLRQKQKISDLAKRGFS